MDQEKYVELELNNHTNQDNNESANIVSTESAIKKSVKLDSSTSTSTSVKVVDADTVDDFDDKRRIQKVFDNICRCCLSEMDNLRHIFDLKECISDLIKQLTSIEIVANDGFPQNVCAECVNQLNLCHVFKQQVKASQIYLNKFVTEGYANGMFLQQIIGINEYNLKERNMDDDLSYDGIDNIDDDMTFDANLIEDQVEHILIPKQNTENVLLDYELNKKSGKTNSEIKSLHCKLDCESEYDSVNYIESNETHPIHTGLNNSFDKSSEDKTCDICLKSFANRITCKRHMKIHSSEKELFYCAKCARRFSNQKVFDHHKRCHDQTSAEKIADKNKSLYKCSVCNFECFVEQDLFIHSSMHSKELQPTCKACNKIFSDKLKLKRHLPTHFKEKPFKCKICSKGFPEMGSLTRHFKNHTNEKKDRRHVCNTCGKKYFDAYALTVHIRTHTGEKPWQCHECGKAFSDCRLLNSHKKIHSGEKLYDCNHCGKRFTHRSTLITHRRIHTGERPYLCVVCSKSFTQASNLQLHMRTHSGEKSFTCKICQKSFASSNTLVNHERVHSGEKPFKCQQCNKRFVRGDLSAHIRTHSEIKPFECNQCEKRFTTKAQYKMHQHKHSNTKPYECKICNKTWSTVTYLNAHIKALHTGNLADNDQQDKRIVGGYDSDAEVIANEALVDDLHASVGVNNQNHEYCESDHLEH